eukprot:2015602-Pyramimonas_sp.AAC.1
MCIRDRDRSMPTLCAKEGRRRGPRGSSSPGRATAARNSSRATSTMSTTTSLSRGSRTRPGPRALRLLWIFTSHRFG